MKRTVQRKEEPYMFRFLQSGRLAKVVVGAMLFGSMWFASFAKSGGAHVKDIVSIVFNSAREPEAVDLAEYVSKGMDYGDRGRHLSMADKGSSFWLKLHDEFGNLPGLGRHRAYGHWGMNQSIPEEFLSAIEKVKPGGAERAVELWREFVITRREAAKQVLNISGPNSDRVAQSISSMMNDIHVLGDLTTVDADGLRSADVAANDFLKSINRILGNHNGLSQTMRSEIREMTRGMNRQAKAVKTLEILKSHSKELNIRLQRVLSRMGFDGTVHQIDYEKLRALASYQPTKTEVAHFWSEYLMDGLETSLRKSAPVQFASKVKNAYNGKIVDVSERLANGAYNTFEKVYSPEMLKNMNNVSKTRQVIGVLQEVTMKDGSTTMVLSIPKENFLKGAKAGISTGVATFFLTEAFTYYSYAQGEISRKDFCWETGKNCAASMLSGTATFVAVTLGAAPGGFVVLGVGVGAYVLCDIAYSQIRRAIEGPDFSIDDVLGKLPTQMQRRKTLWTYDGIESLIEYNGTESVMDYVGGDSLFEYEGASEGVLDFNGNESLFNK